MCRNITSYVWHAIKCCFLWHSGEMLLWIYLFVSIGSTFLPSVRIEWPATKISKTRLIEAIIYYVEWFIDIKREEWNEMASNHKLCIDLSECDKIAIFSPPTCSHTTLIINYISVQWLIMWIIGILANNNKILSTPCMWKMRIVNLCEKLMIADGLR